MYWLSRNFTRAWAMVSLVVVMLAPSFEAKSGMCSEIQSLWERACSRRGHHIQHLRWRTYRFREQARSHRGSSLTLRFLQVVHARADRLFDIRQTMHAVGKRFERQIAAVTAGEQLLNLRRIAKDVALAHQHAMAVADAVQRRFGILDARDVHQPGQLREELLLTGQVMVEGVVNQPEHIQPANRLDRVHRRAFAPQ